MDVLTIIGIAATVVGIIAGIVQVVQYAQERRKRLDTPEEEASAAPTSVVAQIPHNLPPRTEFIGREAEKARIHEALRSRSYLVSIDGIGGIGKTVLALEVAHECLHISKGESPTDGIATFEGFIWTTAKDRDLTLNALLDAVARTLDYPGIAQQPVEEKRIAVQKLLQEKPYLVIVDNFETITDEGVRDFLLELPEPSKALITTREQRLRRVWAISLKGLAEPEALALIRTAGKRLGLMALEQGDERTLLHLYQATGGAPLAIKWAVGQIKQRGQSLDTVLAALHEARGDIFDNIFARSWRLLADYARQVLMVMPIFAASASREGIEAASDVHHFVLDEALGQLVEMSLADATDELDLSQRRYNIHPLTRSFATARLLENAVFEQKARIRLAIHYSRCCEETGIWANTAGFPWFEAELPNIITVMEWADSTSNWSIIVSIFKRLYYFLGTRGYWQDRITYGYRALRAAMEADDIPSAVTIQHSIGWILSRQGQYKEAKALLQSCIHTGLNLGQEEEAVQAMITLAKIAVAQGKLDYAREVIDEAATVARDTSYEGFTQGLLSVRGHIELKSGNYQAARSLLLRALEVTKEQNLGTHIGSRQIDLGNVALAQNQLGEAAAYFDAGLKSSQQFLRQDNIAKAELGLAQILAFRGNNSEAKRWAIDAREQFMRMGMKPEVDETDALLQQLEDSEGQSGDRRIREQSRHPRWTS